MSKQPLKRRNARLADASVVERTPIINTSLSLRQQCCLKMMLEIGDVLKVDDRLRQQVVGVDQLEEGSPQEAWTSTLQRIEELLIVTVWARAPIPGCADRRRSQEDELAELRRSRPKHNPVNKTQQSHIAS